MARERTLVGAADPSPGGPKVAVLTIQAGAEAGRILPLERDKPNMLGREDSECTMTFDDARLSRVHARIVAVNGEWMLTDQGSTNGTFVNDVRVVKHAQLADGDRVVLGGSVSLRFALVTDEERQALMRVYEAAVHDGLTGVLNRKALDQRLQGEIAFAVRHDAPLSVVMLDVDHFKVVNDTHGHPAGDAVLREVAARLTRALRTEDVLGRYGGEEFLIVARDITLDRGAQLAERLRVLIDASPVVVEGTAIAVSASFGVASLACCGATRDAPTLLGTADARLYDAKHAGRNRVVARGGRPAS
ncbi:MAG TPA: GGDEF domain-containing protein [Polyangiaceae bacterium]|jgi:diguanylate cyclase (GGDEF)-like protein